MIMMTLKFTGQIPFKTVYVHGLVRDAEGQKMSKSKGNVLDPIDLIDGISLENLVEENWLADAAQDEASNREGDPASVPEWTAKLRHRRPPITFCSLASTGRDINFDVGRIEDIETSAISSGMRPDL